LKIILECKLLGELYSLSGKASTDDVCVGRIKKLKPALHDLKDSKISKQNLYVHCFCRLSRCFFIVYKAIKAMPVASDLATSQPDPSCSHSATTKILFVGNNGTDMFQFLLHP
jgi:hypothetical protein